MSNQKMFRSALSGYNREDVNTYIKDTDTRHYEEVEALKIETESLRTKLNDEVMKAEALEEEKKSVISELSLLREKEIKYDEILNELNSNISELNVKLTELRKEADFYKAESQAQLNSIAALKSEKESLLKKISDSDQSIAEKTAEIDDLRIKLTEVNNKLNDKSEENSDTDKNDTDSDAYKLSMYNKISAQLGDIIIKANRNADEIISKAKCEAEEIKIKSETEAEQKRNECSAAISKIKSETEEEAAYIRERLSFVAEDLLSHVSADLHGSIESCVREISTYISDMQYEIKSLLTKISSRSDEMYERISYYQSCVADGIDKRLCDIDEKYGIRAFDSSLNTDNE